MKLFHQKCYLHQPAVSIHIFRLMPQLCKWEELKMPEKLNSTQKQQLFQAINQMTEEPQFLFLGEARINVLQLNLELDKIDVNHIHKN